jgi:hypothetical protein
MLALRAMIMTLVRLIHAIPNWVVSTLLLIVMTTMHVPMIHAMIHMVASTRPLFVMIMMRVLKIRATWKPDVYLHLIPTTGAMITTIVPLTLVM